MPRVLIVEDHKKLRESLRRGLSEEGYDVLDASSGEDAFYRATNEGCDVMVLDVMLPGRDGFQVLRDLRNRGFRQPVIMLTARDTVDDRVHGLDLGADDYLVKPFAFAELVARLRALLRRDTGGREVVLRAHDLEMDLVARSVTRAGTELDLTKRESELLEYLLRNKNTTVTRDMIAREVWKETSGSLTNVIEVYINALRKKVELNGSQQLICTVRGVGYVLRDR